jgi:hypothetical protein
MMRHTAVTLRFVNVTAISPAFIRGDHDHMQPYLELRKQQTPASFDPGQGGRIGQEQMRLATEDRDFPGFPRGGNAIANAGVIRRERRGQLQSRIVCERDRFAARQQLDINISQPKEGIVPTNECEHASVGG